MSINRFGFVFLCLLSLLPWKSLISTLFLLSPFFRRFFGSVAGKKASPEKSPLIASETKPKKRLSFSKYARKRPEKLRSCENVLLFWLKGKKTNCLALLPFFCYWQRHTRNIINRKKRENSTWKQVYCTKPGEQKNNYTKESKNLFRSGGKSKTFFSLYFPDTCTKDRQPEPASGCYSLIFYP